MHHSRKWLQLFPCPSVLLSPFFSGVHRCPAASRHPASLPFPLTASPLSHRGDPELSPIATSKREPGLHAMSHLCCCHTSLTRNAAFRCQTEERALWKCSVLSRALPAVSVRSVKPPAEEHCNPNCLLPTRNGCFG